MQSQRNGHTILVGEDELEVRAYLEMALKCLGYSVELAEDGEEVLSHLRSTRAGVSAVLLDLMMPQRDGMEVLQEIRHIAPNLPVIIVSGAGSTLNVVAAMKSGATDFLCKPVTHDELRHALSKALENKIASEPAPLTAPSARTKAFFGASPQMQEIQALIGHVGWSEAPILIQGETGSGKEILARELHANSPRASKVFLKLNCAALPSELVESELFGYERGAFTGAFQKKIGMFETADGGTILLDEIGDMDVRLQAKLLQVLQDREFQRIGGKEVIKVDVRVMAATHRDLEKAMLDRSFREDLYYRLNVINLQLPPLRERKEDIVPLAEYLLKKHAVAGRGVSLTLDLKHALMAYHWPGNVRELENVMRKLIVLRAPELIARELHAKASRKPLLTAVAGSGVAAEAGQSATNAIDRTPILEQVIKAKQQAETEAILAALNSTRWNRKQAAALLKIDYKALLYKMKKLGLEDNVLSFAPPSTEEPQHAMTAASAGGN
ncbi:MAG: sigma-54 dependent transcriptional regulator [Acidobacteriia bacterium]|nr:sigma-54 dependent transcriptional regulator [Terriglobia bacterium]